MRRHSDTVSPPLSRRLIPMVAGALLLVLAFTGDALATFPGANGRIAFVRGDAIWTVNPDGSGVRQLTGPPAGVSHADPAWSASGERLAMARLGPALADQGIVSVGSDGRGLRWITHGDAYSRDVHPAWSPDGGMLAFEKEDTADPCDCGALWLVAADGTGDHRVLGATPPDSPPGPQGFWPDWRPQGDLIAYTDGYVPTSDLRLIGATGTDRGVFPGYPSAGCFSSANPSWSPDGRRVVVDYYDCTSPAGDVAGIGVADLSDPGLHPILSSTAGCCDIGKPVWSPDGSAIVFERYADGADSLFVMGADGSEPHLLVADARAPAWQPIPPSGPLPVVSAPGVPATAAVAPAPTPGAASSPVVASRGGAPLRARVSGARNVRRGAPLRVTVLFSAVQSGLPTVLQQRVRGRWTTLRTTRVSGRSAIFTITLTRPGRARLRVGYIASGVRRTSATMTVRVIVAGHRGHRR